MTTAATIFLVYRLPTDDNDDDDRNPVVEGAFSTQGKAQEYIDRICAPVEWTDSLEAEYKAYAEKYIATDLETAKMRIFHAGQALAQIQKEKESLQARLQRALAENKMEVVADVAVCLNRINRCDSRSARRWEQDTNLDLTKVEAESRAYLPNEEAWYGYTYNEPLTGLDKSNFFISEVKLDAQ